MALVTVAMLVAASMIVQAASAMPVATYGTEDWIEKLTDKVLTIQFDAANADHGRLRPYLQQLTVVRAAWLQGNGAEVYSGVNRFMDMLQARENGISEATATVLFDYGYEVTPAKFHDVGRHLDRFKKDGAPYGDVFMRDAGGTWGAALDDLADGR